MTLSITGMKQHPKGSHGMVLELDLRMILAGLAKELPREGGGLQKTRVHFLVLIIRNRIIVFWGLC